jgi:hypothetical protein
VARIVVLSARSAGDRGFRRLRRPDIGPLAELRSSRQATLRDRLSSGRQKPT